MCRSIDSLTQKTEKMSIEDQHSTLRRQHLYPVTIQWTGNTGTGTSGYRNYERSHTIHIVGKEVIHASSDPTFRGDPRLHNPEELLVASLSSCHMLWFLHLCSDAGVHVYAYTDEATGIMLENTDGSGRFTEVVLRPIVEIRNPAHVKYMTELHQQAHQRCFIANSVNFPVRHEATTRLL